MINILRKNQKALWIVIALLCIPFVFYFSNSKVGPIGNNQFGRIYGRAIPMVELQRNARLFNLARDLGMFSFLQSMIAGANSENEAYAEFTWNRLILHHEAERLGIHPDANQIAGVVKNLRPFLGNAGFDINKYNEFSQNVLPSLGFTDAEIEELASDQLSIDRLKELLGAGVQISEAESKENYERAYGKLDVVVARLHSDELAKEIKISDDDIAKYYDGHKAALNTEEKRKVNFVTFALSDEQKKLTGKPRVEALQKLADQANDFDQALLEKGAQFEQVAAKFQLPIQTTGDFTQIAPDPLLKGNAQLTAAAFQLTPQDPNSDAVQVADGFYVLHLNGIDAAKPLTLEEAKSKIVAAIRSERLQELLSTKGAEAAEKIRAALKSGASADAAIQQAGLAAEKIPPFALADSSTPKTEPGKPAPPVTPDLRIIKGTAAEMNPGEVSELIPSEKGGLIAILEKREAPEMASYEAGKAMMNARFINNKRELAFHEWLSERRRDAGVPATAG